MKSGIAPSCRSVNNSSYQLNACPLPGLWSLLSICPVSFSPHDNLACEQRYHQEFIGGEGRRGTPLFVKLLRNPLLSILQSLRLDLPTFLFECGFIIERDCSHTIFSEVQWYNPVTKCKLAFPIKSHLDSIGPSCKSSRCCMWICSKDMFCPRVAPMWMEKTWLLRIRRWVPSPRCSITGLARFRTLSFTWSYHFDRSHTLEFRSWIADVIFLSWFK